jgi:enamine deaminase RidA (YjgF/YER057c/UK114 family)
MSDQKWSEHDSLFGDVPYEYGAIAPAGAILFTAGACPLDSNGNIVGPGDPVEQAGAALHNLIVALARFGAAPEDLVKTTVYVVGDRSDLVAVWNVVEAGLAPTRPPSTLLGVSVLGYPGQLVEIEGIASLSRSSGPQLSGPQLSGPQLSGPQLSGLQPDQRV